MMSPPDLNMQLRRRVTLTFDLLTTLVDHLISLPLDHLRQFVANSVHLFSKYHVHKFCNGRTDGRTDGRTCREHYACCRSPVCV